MPQPRRRVAACGTISGHVAHHHRGETPCRACKEARNEYARRYYRLHIVYKPIAREAESLRHCSTGEPCGTPDRFVETVNAGETPCSACVRAARTLLLSQQDNGVPMKNCGTTDGFRVHSERGEDPCADCREAALRWHRENSPRAHIEQRKAAMACGTELAHDLHKSRGEPPCDACKKAKQEAIKERRLARYPVEYQAQILDAECGTLFGRERHFIMREKVCPECYMAHIKHREQLKNETRASEIENLIFCYENAPCGTHDRFVQTVNEGGDPCLDCKKAARAFLRKRGVSV